jgi:hypothetical protein
MLGVVLPNLVERPSLTPSGDSGVKQIPVYNVCSNQVLDLVESGNENDPFAKSGSFPLDSICAALSGLG